MRLAELYALDIVDRFRPQSWGSPTPFHWVLGPLGAALVAAETGVDLSDLAWRRTLTHDLAASQRLAHLVGLNGFFTGLLRSARTRPGCYLDQWWSERRCAREWGEVVRPDGYGIWTEHGTALTEVITVAINSINLSLYGPVKVDDWLLYHHHSTFAGAGTTHAENRVYDLDGALVASFSVDAMVRPLPNGATGPMDARTAL